MFIIAFRGGLGNQMFQYAFAIMLDEKFGQKIVFNHYFLNRDKDGRSYSLHHYSLRNQSKLNRVSEFLLTIYYKMKLRILEYKCQSDLSYGNKNFEFLTTHGLYISKDLFKALKIKSPIKRINFVDGFFQSYKYFDEYKERIRCEFKTKTLLKKESEKMLERIQHLKNPVCVHIRLGDYLSNKWKNEVLVCTEKYYNKGINYIASKIENPTFFIFSNSHNDIEWIKKNFHFDIAVEYVDLSNCDYEDMTLMSSCKHFVLSNSSFSWWSQYLSPISENKIVIAPNRWHLSDLDSSDLYMPEWTILKE